MGLRCFVQSKGCEEEQEEQPAEGRHLRMETRRSRRPSGHQKKSPQLRVRPGRMKERRISQFLCTRNWRVREVMRTLLHRIWAWRSCCNPQAFFYDSKKLILLFIKGWTVNWQVLFSENRDAVGKRSTGQKAEIEDDETLLQKAMISQRKSLLETLRQQLR